MKPLNPEFVHEDSRRKLVQLLTADIKQVNVYEANHGVELGHHFHKETIEYFYVVRGTLEYNNKVIMKKGDIFYPAIGEMHTVKVISDKATFMTFLTKPYDNERPDIHV